MSRIAPRAIADPDVQAFGVLLESYRSLERVLATGLATQTSLTHTWFEALLRLASRPDHQMSMGRLAAEMDLSSSGLTRVVDRLVQHEFVERFAAQHDRRVQIVRVTAKGGAELEAAAAVHSANVRSVFTDRLEPDELALFLEILQRLHVDDATDLVAGA